MTALRLIGTLACFGASHAACTPQWTVPGFHLVDVDVGEQGKRNVLLHIPDRTIQTKPAPALAGGGVVGFHGWHSNPWYYERLTGLGETTAHHGMVLALPFGTPPKNSSSPFCCPAGCDEICCSRGDQLDSQRPCGWSASADAAASSSSSSEANNNSPDDLAYTAAIVDLLVQAACVDRSKIFLTGLSAGSGMANKAACQMAGTFRGVAGMSGGLGKGVLCQPEAGQASFLSFCGTADRTCFPRNRATASAWATLNACAGPPQPSYHSATTRCHLHADCAGGSFVETCEVKQLGDAIPGHDRFEPLYPGEPLQAPSNVDAIKYTFDRFSSLFEPDF